MKYIDLYSGIGGFRIALDEMGHKCVFSADIDPFSVKTYKTNFKDNSFFNLDNVNDLTDDEINELIPDHELLTAGFPCQPFSNAGKKMGFNTEDSKGNQFFNILKILKIKKPKHIFLENVSHLENHDNGETWKVIKSSLKKLNYNILDNLIKLSPDMIGVPQNRKRVFIIGHLDQKPKEFKIISNFKSFKNIFSEKDLNNDKYKLDSKLSYVFDAWQNFMDNIIFPKNRTLPVVWIDYMIKDIEISDKWSSWKKKYIIDMKNLYQKNKKFIDYWYKKYNVEEWTKRDKKFEWQAGKNERNMKNTIISLRQSGIRCKAKPIFPTLVAMVQIPIIFDKKLNYFRFLTPKEVSRLQSFPEKFILNENDYNAYKQFGNSVNVKVIKYIASYYFNKLDSHS